MLLCLWVQTLLRDSCDLGGIGWLAAGGIPNSLYLPSARIVSFSGMCVVCVEYVVVSFILDVRFVDVPAGVAQDFSTFLLRCLP